MMKNIKVRPFYESHASVMLVRAVFFWLVCPS